MYIGSDIWQHFGWRAIIYLAALTAIDQEQYDAAWVDGANRWQQLRFVTLPGIAPTIIILMILYVGQMMSVGFEKMGTAINVSITLMVAYPLSRRPFRGRGLLMFYIAFTMWFSGGIIPTLIIVRNLGLYATRWAMVLPTAAAAWNIIITRTCLHSNIDDSIPESAKIDGANDLTIFFRIVIPVSSTIIAVNVLFYALRGRALERLLSRPDLPAGPRSASVADDPAQVPDPAA